MIDFNDMVIRLINESRPLVFPPELEEVYEKIMKHVESNSAPKEWSQGIYMPKIYVRSVYNDLFRYLYESDTDQGKMMGELLRTKYKYKEITGGLDELRSFVNGLVETGFKACKLHPYDKKNPWVGGFIQKLYKAYYDNYNNIVQREELRLSRNLRALGERSLNDNSVKKMLYRIVINSEVWLDNKVPSIIVNVNVNGVKDELRVYFSSLYRRGLGSYSSNDFKEFDTHTGSGQQHIQRGVVRDYKANVIDINLPNIGTMLTRISNDKDTTPQWPSNYSRTPDKESSFTIENVLQMYDTRNTKSLATVNVVKEVVRHELMHYYEKFFKHKGIEGVHKYGAYSAQDRNERKFKDPVFYLTQNDKITGRIAAEFYPRLRELLEVVPKDALEGFLRTLDIKPLKKFFFKRLGVMHSLTKVPLGTEQWLDATLKVPYLKRKLLEKIYNFINNK